MNRINPFSVDRAVEVHLRDRSSTTLTDLCAAIFGKAPDHLSGPEFGMLVGALKSGGWVEFRNRCTGSRHWRRAEPQEAARTPISPPEDIDDAQADIGRQRAA